MAGKKKARFTPHPTVDAQAYSPAQEVMRREMLEDPRSLQVSDGALTEPAKLRSVLDDVLGPQYAEEGDSTISVYGAFQRRVPELAYEVINQHELQLSLSQWQVVQSMVEAGIRRGFDEGYLR